MKELSIEQKAKRYDEVLAMAKECITYIPDEVVNKYILNMFHELQEIEHERIKKAIIELIKQSSEVLSKQNQKQMLAWLEKQGEKHLENYGEAEKEKVDFVGDGFIECHADFLDFKEGNTYWLEYIGDDKYNVRSDNLLGKTYHITPCQLYTVFKKLTWLEKQGQVKESFVSQHEIETCKENDVSLTSEDERIRKGLIKAVSGILKGHTLYETDVTREEAITWLEKQGTSSQVSIWKHWKNGIAGNGEGEPIYLIKIGNTYSFSSCLSVECDYIELSELDNLMLEKQGKKPQGKTALEAIKEEKVDNRNCIKPADKVEPKFHKDDWVIGRATNNEPRQIAEVKEEGYKTTYGGWIGFSFEKDMRLWTIEDAKDGDVLARNNDVKSICIFAHFDGINKEKESFLCHCGLEGEGLVQELSINGYHDDSNGYVPATKEQRDTLFAMLEAVGYEWDSDNKLPKKIVKEGPENTQSDKFDITTFQPFDKVLVRDNATYRWSAGLYSYYRGGDKYPFVCNSVCWKQCVPYNDDTKHLIGTMDDAPGFYKTWEL